MILKTIQKVLNTKEHQKTTGKERSPEWGKVRKYHLAKQPFCAVCGKKEKLQVHHINPFHLHPELELDPNNLITLCENGNKTIDCHLVFGHFGNFRTKNNPNIVKDSEYFNSNLTAK